MSENTLPAATKPDAVGAPTPKGASSSQQKRSRAKPAKAEPTRYYEIDALDFIPARWAGELSRELRVLNALRDPTREPPHLIFTDGEAFEAGVAAADLGGLPELSVDQIAALTQKAVMRRLSDYREFGDDVRR